jgi:hypothetical protein
LPDRLSVGGNRREKAQQTQKKNRNFHTIIIHKKHEITLKFNVISCDARTPQKVSIRKST